MAPLTFLSFRKFSKFNSVLFFRARQPVSESEDTFCRKPLLQLFWKCYLKSFQDTNLKILRKCFTCALCHWSYYSETHSEINQTPGYVWYYSEIHSEKQHGWHCWNIFDNAITISAIQGTTSNCTVPMMDYKNNSENQFWNHFQCKAPTLCAILIPIRKTAKLRVMCCTILKPIRKND